MNSEELNKGWTLIFAAALTVPIYTTLIILGYPLPTWTYWITIGGFIFGMPLVLLEHWLHQDDVNDMEKAPK